ncbi:cytochrome c553 [Rhodobacteraceae bacterium MBR-64]
MNKTALAIVAVLAIAGGYALWTDGAGTGGAKTDGAGTGVTGHSMVPPDTSGIATGGALVDVVLPASLSAPAQTGRQIFNLACASCHGTDAAGRNGKGPPLIHRIYEPGHHGDQAFMMAPRNGVRAHHWKFGDMPPIPGLSDGDLKQIARFVREVQAANGIN